MAKLPKDIVNHPVAKVSGVKATDSRIEAANKAIEVMKLAKFPEDGIRKAIAIRDAAIKRGVT